jgi:DNA-binding CsgD family transcriptional regulator
VPARVSSPSFIGRADELAALDSALERAAAGQSAAVLLGGDAGMGKSRLVAEFEERARAAGADVLVGQCVELADGELPYGPVVAALRPLATGASDGPLEALHPGARAALARLWPELSDSDGRPGPAFEQGQLFEAVHRLIAAHAAERPLVVVVEDLHWADRSTRDLLTFLIRNSRGEPVLFIASYRTDEVHRRHPLHPFVSELERSGRAERVTLPPFVAEEMRQQLSGILGEEPAPQLVERLLERSEGNPFFAEELLAAADRGIMPDSLREVLLLRVERLSDPARRSLELAAAVGRPVAHELLAVASELSPAELRDALREAAEHRVLVPTDDGSGYEFRHALLREAVYEDLLPGERTALHAALGDAIAADRRLADSDRVAAELAHHLYLGGRPGPALTASLEAAEQAERVHAYAEASRYLERALELLERVPPDEVPDGVVAADVARRAADAALLSGGHRRAVALARQLVADTDAEADPTAAGLAHARLARYLWFGGEGDAALGHYEAALELVPSEPSTQRAEVLAAHARVVMLLGRLPEARASGAEALEIARATGDRLVEASVLNTLGPAHGTGDMEQDRANLRLAREIAEELGAVEEVGRSYVNESHLLEELGRLEEAVAVGLEGMARARELGAQRMYGDYLAADAADRLLSLGDWQEASRLATDVLEVSSNSLNAASAHTAMGRIAAERGDFAEARQHVALSEEISESSGGPMWAGPNLAILAACALWEGDVDQARSVVATGVEQIGDSAALVFTAPLWTLGVRAEADRAARARALGQQEEAEAGAAAARGLLEQFEVAETDSVRQVARERKTALAELSRLLGENDPEAWLAAADDWREAPQPYRVAYAEWRAAEAIVGSGGSDDAQPLLRSALRAATRLQAQPLLAEIAALARRARLDVGDGAPATVAQAAAAGLGLTERERAVVTLVAAGRTNRQIGEALFISEKTASVHVSRILAKLGAANRAEAAGIAHTLGLAVESGSEQPS